MKTRDIEIKRHAQKQLEYLRRGEEINGGYSEWYDSLKPFRKHICEKYIKYGIPNMYFPKYVKLESGDVIDHHIISYLAPLDYTRIGWNGLRISPQEHILKLSEYFKKRGSRFIYVALPNKGMIDLSLLSGVELLDSKTGNAPQYRKYVRDVIAGGEKLLICFRFLRHIREKAEIYFLKGIIFPIMEQN